MLFLNEGENDIAMGSKVYNRHWTKTLHPVIVNRPHEAYTTDATTLGCCPSINSNKNCCNLRKPLLNYLGKANEDLSFALEVRKTVDI